MFEKPQSSHALGIDLDAFSLKGAAVSLSRGKLKVDKTFDFFIEPQESENDNVKPLYMSDQQAIMDSLDDNTLVVSTAITQDILVRPLEMKLTKDKDINDALAFQVEPLLPYPIENSVIDKVLFFRDKESSKLTIFCIRKDHLMEHLDQWNGREFNPEIVSAAPQALVLFTNQFVQSQNPCFVLQLAYENSFAILMDQGKLVAAQAIPVGINRLVQILGQQKGLDTRTANEQLVQGDISLLNFTGNETLKQAVEELRMAATRTFYSLAKQFKGKEVNDLLVTGPGATIEGLSSIINQQLNKTLLDLKDDVEASAISKKELLNFALPIGAALSALPNCKDQVNFRQQEFVYPEPWKRLKQPILHYFLLCLGVAVSLYFFGNAYVSYQEGKLRQEYLHLLNMMNKSYKSVEAEFAGKSTTSTENDNIAELSLDDLTLRLNHLDRDIQSTPQTFPLRANVPLVSDVLAWISSHPNFISTPLNESVSGKSLQIVSFNYTMVKRPEPTKKQEKYQVKVEMEFSSPTPKMAREFHDALIAPNDMVDPKAEIKWNSNKDLYRTSFYLKDRTTYPNL